MAVVRITQGNADRRVFKDCSPTLLALTQRLFLLFPLSDVDEGYDSTDDCTVAKHRMGPNFDRKAAAVLFPINFVISMDVLSFLKTYVNRTFVDGIRRAVGPGMVRQRMHIFPDQLGRIIVAEQLHSRTVTEKTLTLGVATKDRLSGPIEYELELLLSLTQLVCSW